jgi:hypothetical protein
MRRANEKNRSMEYLSKVERTIRIVNSPGPGGTPLRSSTLIDHHKKTRIDEELGYTLQRQQAHSDEAYDDHIYDAEATSKKKKKTSWFKRASRAEPSTTSAVPGEVRRASSSTDPKQHRSDAESAEYSKKRNFTFPFWKSNKTKDSSMTIEGTEDGPFEY